MAKLMTILRDLRVFIVFCLVVLPGCKKPYEQFKRTEPVTFVKKEAVSEQTDKALNDILAKNMKDMNFEEALEALQYYENAGNEDMVMRLIPHIIALSKDAQLTAELELEFAQRNLASGNLEQAQKLYTNFITYYPGHAKIKTARYHLLLATFWTALEPDREQTLTLAAVDLAKKYLQEFPDDTEYTDKVHDILKACYQALLESELGLVRFYINKFTYERKPSAIEAARMRLEHTKEAYVPILAIYDERAQTLKNTLVAMEKRETQDRQQLLEQGQHVIEQADMLETLLWDPTLKRKIHPRDTF